MQNPTGKSKFPISNDARYRCRFEFPFIFVLFLFSRLISVKFNNINDCDETFNYWEPAHFLLFKSGFQTWEYSPQYAIRSYFYLWLFVWPAKIFTLLFGNDKVAIFYLTRSIFAFVGAVSETFFCLAISKNFDRKVRFLYCVISLFAPGMFNSTTAFLPSTFGQIMTCFAIGFWLRGNYRCFIFSTAFSAIVGWPFTAAISLPMALDVLIKRRLKFIFWSIIWGLAIMVPTILVDSYYYGKVVFASLNIVLYNVFTSHGPELYGSEPLSFYLNNLFLNYNFAFFASFISPLSLLAKIFISGRKGNMVDKKSHIKQMLMIVGLYLWCCIFFFQAHKEERFMYPIYPLLNLCAAFTLSNAMQIIDFMGSTLKKISRTLLFIFLLTFSLLSVSRILALYNGYNASIRIYDQLSHKDFRSTETNQTILCLAKEWHRFPSSFLVPSTIRVEFIPSEFRGQLPKHFESSNEHPTRIVPMQMNDQNKEEIERYVNLSQCELIIDSDYPQYYGRDLPYVQDLSTWSIFARLPFLDNSRSSALFRAFYVPFLSVDHCKFINYNLLRRKKKE